MAAVCIGFSTISCNSSQSHNEPLADGEFLIKGQLKAEHSDSTLLYLVPMEGPHPRPVDSVFIMNDGKFEFRGNVEQMAVLRLTWHQRYGTQELLVVTEPGITEVILDSISSSHGTPQNDALQQWKEHREAHHTEQGDYNYQFLKGQGRNTLSIFLYKLVGSSLDSIRRAELNELLRDTVDRTKPQPGFRR